MANDNTSTNDILKTQLVEAYNYFGLAFPTTASAVNEAYYNKQREIRQNNPSTQYSLMFESNRMKSLIIDNLDVPVKTDNNEETVPIEEVPTSVFAEDTENIKPEEFVLWEEAVNSNQITSHKANKDRYKQKQKKKRHKHKKILIALFWLLVAVIGYIIVSLLLTAFDIHTGPSNNELYEIMLDKGIELSSGQTITVTDETVSDFRVSSTIVSALGKFAYCTVKANVKDDMGVISVRSTYNFKRDTDRTWKYTDQNSSIELKEHNFTGVWEGPYKASKDSTTTSSLRFEIEPVNDNGTYDGICYITSQKGVTGSYSVNIKITGDEVLIQGVEWIEKPTFFIMEDFDCFINIEDKELLPRKDSGSIFSFTKTANSVEEPDKEKSK